MKKHLLTVSFAALLAAAGVAVAQSPKGDAGSAPSSGGAPAAEKSAPADKGSGQMPGNQGGPAADKGGADAPGKGQAQTAPGKDMKSGDAAKDKAGDTKQQKAGDAGKDKAGDTKQQKAGDTGKDKAGDTKQSGTTAGGGTSQSGGGKVTLSQEQQTKARTIFSSNRSQASVNINISPRVGVAVPRTVTLVTIPQELVVIVPEYRSYRYFIVENTVVIVDPDTYVIVDVIVLT